MDTTTENKMLCTRYKRIYNNFTSGLHQLLRSAYRGLFKKKTSFKPLVLPFLIKYTASVLLNLQTKKLRKNPFWEHILRQKLSTIDFIEKHNFSSKIFVLLCPPKDVNFPQNGRFLGFIDFTICQFLQHFQNALS